MGLCTGLLNGSVKRVLMVFVIANKVHANFRRKRKTLPFSDVKGVENTQDTTFSIEKNFRHDELYEALHQLPEAYRNCVILYEIAGFSIKETAAIQECSTDAIKQRLSRGRKMLAEALSEKSTKTITS
jgi:RNA polymerase sigma-70 factor (ECF subfamily)